MSGKYTSSSANSLENVVKIITTSITDDSYRTVINVHGPDYPTAADVKSQLQNHCSDYGFSDLTNKLSGIRGSDRGTHRTFEFTHGK